MDATYVSTSSFTVSGDETAFFTAARVIRADLDADGIERVTVQSSSYAAGPGLTTVAIDETTLTVNMRRATSIDTIREHIIEAIKTKLELILSANGYETELGAKVYKAAINFKESDLPGILILPGFEESERQYKQQINVMSVTIAAVAVLADGDNASDEVESMLGDMIFNLFNYNDDTTFGGLAIDTFYNGGGTEKYPIPDEEQIVTAQVEIDVKYETIAGDPYSNPPENE